MQQSLVYLTERYKTIDVPTKTGGSNDATYGVK
jgi:hypothetical protein